MSYGYRLNVEQLFIKNAKEKWLTASARFLEVNDSDELTGKTIIFCGPDAEDEIAVSLCIETVLYLSIAVEAFVNLAWNTFPDTKCIDERDFGKTINKIKKLLSYQNRRYGDINSRKNLVELISLRDSLVHYKEKITYLGFSFAPKYQKDFDKVKIEGYFKAVNDFIVEIGRLTGLDVGFVSEDNYSIFHWNQ